MEIWSGRANSGFEAEVYHKIYIFSPMCYYNNTLVSTPTHIQGGSMNNYDTYLPYIAVEEGQKRVLGNLQVYIRLLNKFELRSLVSNLIDSIGSGNYGEVIKQAHAIKGTASNLSLIALYEIMLEVEGCAKNGQELEIFVPALTAAMDETEKMIAALAAEVGK